MPDITIDDVGCCEIEAALRSLAIPSQVMDGEDIVAAGLRLSAMIRPGFMIEVDGQQRPLNNVEMLACYKCMESQELNRLVEVFSIINGR